MDFANLVTRRISLMTLINVVSSDGGVGELSLRKRMGEEVDIQQQDREKAEETEMKQIKDNKASVDAWLQVITQIRMQKKSIKSEILWCIKANHVKAFYCVTQSPTLSLGIRAAVELCGLGKLRPNMVLMGFLERWWMYPDRAEEYFQVTIQY